jgi:hypothetical protein
MSDDREGQGLGVQRQEEDCRDLALRHRLEVGEVFKGNDTGASTVKEAPARLRGDDAARGGLTSGCWTKAKENGRIELIDGARLIAVTREHLGKKVLIGGPAGKRGDRPAT